MELKHSLPDYSAFKRAIVVTVIALILLIIGFSAWKSIVEYRLTVRAAELQSRGYARALKEHTERAFGEADSLLLETIEHIKDHGGMDRENSRLLRDFMMRRPRTIPQVSGITLITRDGQLFAHSLDTPIKNSDASDREFFIHHSTHPEDDNLFISRPFKSRLINRWRFTISRPVRSATGAFEGVVALGFEMEYFRNFYASLDLGKKGRIVMMRKDGALLLSEPYKESDFSVDFSKSFLFRQYLPKSPKGTFHVAGGKALLESGGRIISYESLAGFPVVVNANMGTDEVTANWRQGTYKQAFITLATCLALVALTILLLRQIRRIELGHRRQAEQQVEISAAAAAWQVTFDSVADAIWVMDLNRHIMRCNKATTTLFGKDTDHIVGHLCCDVAHNGSMPLSNCPFQQMLDNRRRATVQLAIGERWFEVAVDPIFADNGDISGAVHIVSDITGIKAAEERYRLLVDNLPVVCWQADEHGNALFISSVATKIEGYSPEEIYAGGDAFWMDRIHPDDQSMVSEAFRMLFADGAVYDVQFRIRHKQGHWVWLHAFAYATMLQDGVRVAHGMFSDVTARKQAEDERDQLETQLRQAQKMEAIGHLAGGIAHDFNNLLTPIMGYAEMAAARIADHDPLVPKLAGILAAAHKAKDLTRQLLSFGRRQPISSEVIDLNDVILSFNSILRRTIRESIRIDLVLDPEGAFIKADKSQMEQIIINMTVNAQDAFGDAQGRIIIETCRVHMDGENARIHPGMAPGEYMLLSFQDNGCGMSADVMNHIFEPFFTTKQVGHGTGLGLATVYGIVKQHDAHITVTSREGEGTSFRIFFPCCALQPLVQAEAAAVVRSRTAGEATILVVEDNDMVREMVKEMLEGIGYTIITAADPHRAIELMTGNSTQIDLLISDVVMPGMSGPELYEQLVVQIPGLRVVYISGYPINPGIRGGVLEDEVSYLQKPFTAEALLERIRQVL